MICPVYCTLYYCCILMIFVENMAGYLYLTYQHMKSILIFLVIAYCSDRCTAQPGITKQLDSLFHKQFNNTGPGGAVLIAQNGHIIYKKGFGIEDVHTTRRITTFSLFNL